MPAALPPDELSPSFLIGRVMSGKAEYRSSDYLDAFKNLSMSLLNHPSYSKGEIIKLWNSLQSCPPKVRYITMSLVTGNGFVQRQIEKNYSHAKYAWIKHDLDDSDNKHYHYVLLFPNPVSMRSVADDLQIPLPMVEKVISKKGILDYLTHENDSSKHHYPLTDVHANFDIQEEKQRDESIDIKQFFHHF